MFDVVNAAVRESGKDRISRLAAELSYYTVFSIAPMFIVIIAIVGLFMGRETAQTQLFHFMRGIAGGGAADAVALLVQGSHNGVHGAVATVIAIGATLLGSIGVFAQLKDALNIIWRAPERRFGLKRAIRDNALAFGLLLAFAFLLAVSLVVSAGVEAIAAAVGRSVPEFPFLGALADVALTTVVAGIGFAAIFAMLPDVRVPWRSALAGGAATGVLFSLGQLALAAYLGHAAFASSYGAAGALMVLLIWVYYSAQIALFGSELTKVLARRLPGTRDAAASA